MNYINSIAINNAFDIIVISLVSMALAQILKFIRNIIKNKEIDIEKLYTTGGMPSSHSSLVSSLVVSIILFEGVSSISFAVAFVLALVTIHDSMGIRLEASKHAKLLNKIINDLPPETKEHYGVEKELKEPLGHMPIEVLIGIVLGVLVAVIGYFILK